MTVQRDKKVGESVRNRPKLDFYQVTMQSAFVALGAVGWVDTDVSAITGTDTNKIWLIVSSPQGADLVQGARPHGSALDPSASCQNSGTFLSKVDSAGHMDLRRAASNITYQFIGYFE